MSSQLPTARPGTAAARLVPLALLALALAGCAAPAPDAAPRSSAAPGAAATPDARPAAPEPTPTTEAECIVGTWELDNASFVAALHTVGEGELIVDSLTGTARLVVAEGGAAETSYVNWKHVASVVGQPATITMERNGTDYGTIVEVDGALGLQELSNESIMITQIEMGGVVQAGPKTEGASLSLGIFQCEGDRLSITVDGTTSYMDRVS